MDLSTFVEGLLIGFFSTIFIGFILVKIVQYGIKE
jgi:hypothetical protein